MRANKLSLSFAVNTFPIMKYKIKGGIYMMKKIAVKLLTIVAMVAIAPFTIGGFVVTSIFEVYKVVWKVIVGK